MKQLLLISVFALLSSCQKEQIIDTDATNKIDSTNGVPNVIVSELRYSEPTSNYSIDTAYFDQDVLTIKIASGGCSGATWGVELIDQGVVLESFPEQRNIKVLLTNKELCKAYIMKEFQFNISELKINDSGKFYLNLKDYKKELLYEY